MKSLLPSSAILLMIASPAFANTETAAPAPFLTGLETPALSASELIGQPLFQAEGTIDPATPTVDDWERVGEITDVVVGTGSPDAVLAEIGGFLGIGERVVAIDMDHLQFSADGEAVYVVLNGATNDLEGAPEFDLSYARGRTAGVAAVAAEGSGMTTQDSATVTTVQTGSSASPMSDGQPEGTDSNTASLDAGTIVQDPRTPATAIITEDGAQTVSN